VKFAPEEQAFDHDGARKPLRLSQRLGTAGWTTILLEAINVSELRDT
jgi:hypothetical protein